MLFSRVSLDLAFIEPDNSNGHKINLFHFLTLHTKGVFLATEINHIDCFEINPGQDFFC